MKTKTGHTPGPWEFNDLATIGTTTGAERETFVAVISVEQKQTRLLLPSNSQRVANARLIAAAPDQNAILRKIVERLDRWQSWGIAAGPDGKDADFEELKAEAHATLAKAEGKEAT